MSGIQNIRDQSFQGIVDHMHVFMPGLVFTELSPLQKLQFLIGTHAHVIILTKSVVISSIR